MRRFGLLLGISLTCGLILSLSFRDLESSIPAWIALAPIMAIVSHAKCRRRAIIYSTVFSLSWVTASLTFFWHLTPPGVIAASIYTALYYIVALLLIRRISAFGGVNVVLGSAAIWTLFEILRAVVPVFGFPWLLLGHTLIYNESLRQGADLLGVYGLSFVIAAFNAALAFALPALWEARFRIRSAGSGDNDPILTASKQAWTACSVVGALILGVFVYGRARLAEIEPSLRAGPPLAVIQGNTLHKVNRTLEEMQDQLNQHLALHRFACALRDESGEKPVAICWAETMVPGTINIDDLGKSFNAGIVQCGLPTLTGANYRLPNDSIESGSACCNAACLFDPSGKEVLHYFKRRLVPFGEYVPFSQYPFFNWLGSVTRDQYRPGDSVSPVFPLGDYHVALNICVEDIHPDLAREAARAGADTMINLTNDGWFAGTYGPRAHLMAAAWRAIEVRRPLLRVTNTGRTVSIDPLGRITPLIPELTEGTALVRLQRIQTNDPSGPRTPTLYLGEWGAIVIFTLVLLAAVLLRSEAPPVPAKLP